MTSIRRACTNRHPVSLTFYTESRQQSTTAICPGYVSGMPFIWDLLDERDVLDDAEERWLE